MNAPRPSEPPSLLGPGRFILVVGPSGAGKDTILAGARQATAQNSPIVFPRRVVTRETDKSEDHDSLNEAEFVRRCDQDGFALHWQAHGHHYGIPRSIDDEIRAGRTVVCNVSRSIVDDVRARYANVTVVLVTAPRDVLAERLSGRARATDGSVAERVGRNDAYADFAADVTIDNSGAPHTAIRRLLETING